MWNSLEFEPIGAATIAEPDKAEWKLKQLAPGMSLRTWFAGTGAGALCSDADADLWGYFRANAATVLEALEAYDDYMRKRDWRHADAMLAMLAEREK